jgi:hypothetical protein
VRLWEVVVVEEEVGEEVVVAPSICLCCQVHLRPPVLPLLPVFPRHIA